MFSSVQLYFMILRYVAMRYILLNFIDCAVVYYVFVSNCFVPHCMSLLWRSSSSELDNVSASFQSFTYTNKNSNIMNVLLNDYRSFEKIPSRTFRGWVTYAKNYWRVRLNHSHWFFNTRTSYRHLLSTIASLQFSLTLATAIFFLHQLLLNPL